MPISVDTLRGLAAKQTLVFDSASQTLSKASAKHSFASFFGTKTAKAVNRETMGAIKKAMLSDPRYFAVREKAAQMLSTIDKGGKVDSSKIKSIVNHLDSISTPEMQKKQLSERFTMHLSNRELPEGWSSHTGEIISYLNRNMDTFIRDAGGNAGNVNPSLVLANLCETLSAVSEACGGDARAIDLAATLLKNRPQLIDTPEKARDVMGRWVPGNGNQHTIERMFTGSAGQEGDAVISSRREQMKVLQFNQRELPGTLTDPDTYLRNRMNERGKVRMNEDFSLSMHRFASNKLTMFEKDINRSMNVVLPNGVRLPFDCAMAREEVAKYVAGNPNATFAGLDAAARNKAWLLMSLLSQETEKIAIETAPTACSSDGFRSAYMIRWGEEKRSFTVVETETGDWIVRNEASYRIDGICYDEIDEPVMTGPDTCLDTSTEICVPRAEIDRIAGLDASTFTGVGAVSLDAAVSVSTVHRLTPPLSGEGKAQYEISQISGKLGLTDGETRLFETVAGYETALLGSATDALPVLKNSQSPARRLISYPALLADQSTYAQCKELMTVFNRVFDGLSKGENPTMPANYRKTVERFVFDELNALAASGRKLPSVKDFEKSLASGNPYLDFARWGFSSAEMTHSLLVMPMKFRQPLIAALKAFYESTDIMLFNRLVEHRDGIQRLHSQGKLTAASAYAEIMGKDAPVPFNARTRPINVQNCFANAIMDGVGGYVAKNSGSNPNVAAMMGPVYMLLSKYSISVEDAFSIALGERHIGEDLKILNPFVPMVYQKIGGDVGTALDGLARDLNRMTYGYAADGRMAKIAPGSVFTFHLPDGMDTSVSSQPVGLDARQLEEYNSGNRSSITRLLGLYMWKLCGVGHESQVASLILGLGQGCLEPLRNMAAIYGVEANEHSQVRIDLRKLENGDVELRVSNPENCPLEFDWTVTVSPDGKQKMSEVNMRRAAGFVAVGEEAQ